MSKSRVSVGQLEILNDFFSNNPLLARGYAPTQHGRLTSKNKWKEVTKILNSYGDGAHKSAKDWQKYWNDKKSKLKKRVASLKKQGKGIGGGVSGESDFSEIESRLLLQMGQDLGAGAASEAVDASPPREVVNAIEMPLNRPIQEMHSPGHAVPPGDLHVEENEPAPRRVRRARRKRAQQIQPLTSLEQSKALLVDIETKRVENEGRILSALEALAKTVRTLAETQEQDIALQGRLVAAQERKAEALENLAEHVFG